MLARFAFDVCHDVYLAAREAIDAKIPTLSPEASGKYQWRPDRLPRLAEYVCDFTRAGERALGGDGRGRSRGSEGSRGGKGSEGSKGSGECGLVELPGADRDARFSRGVFSSISSTSFTSSTSFISATCLPRPSRLAMFRLYYLGGAGYQPARRHLGISEITWADWADEIRYLVGRELTRAGVFPPSRYFREAS